MYFKVLNQNAQNPRVQAISWIFAKKCTFGLITNFCKNRSTGRDLNPSNPHKHLLFQNSSSPCCRAVNAFDNIMTYWITDWYWSYFCKLFLIIFSCVIFIEKESVKLSNSVNGIIKPWYGFMQMAFYEGTRGYNHARCFSPGGIYINYTGMHLNRQQKYTAK